MVNYFSDPTARWFPSLEKAKLQTQSLCPVNCLLIVFCSKSQMITDLSPPPDASSLPHGEKVNALILPVCPFKVSYNSDVKVS